MRYFPRPYCTADGISLEVGMTVYALNNETTIVEQHIIKEICEGGLKVIFENGGGWRVDGVFINAEFAKEVYESRFIHLKLDEESAGLICYALAQRLKSLNEEVRILQISKDRELTRLEKSMLPLHLLKEREDLRDQINPWTSLVYHYESLVAEIDKEIDRVKTFSRDFNVQKEEV